VAGCRQAAGVPELHLEAAQVVQVLQPVVEARHVDVLAADAQVVLHAVAVQRRQESGDVHAQLLAQVAPDDIGPLPMPFGILRRISS
jgi:hypothetical protein